MRRGLIPRAKRTPNPSPASRGSSSSSSVAAGVATGAVAGVAGVAGVAEAEGVAGAAEGLVGAAGGEFAGPTAELDVVVLAVLGSSAIVTHLFRGCLEQRGLLRVSTGNVNK